MICNQLIYYLVSKCKVTGELQIPHKANIIPATFSNQVTKSPQAESIF